MKCFLYPDIGRMDEPLQIHMNGLIPKEPVKLHLQWKHPNLGIWKSELTTYADQNGKLSNKEKNELATLIWNLRPSQSQDNTVLMPTDIAPLVFHLDIEATVSNRTESRTLTRLFKEDHIAQQNITSTFEGSYFYPKNAENYPVIIVLGYDNVKLNNIASLLASNGYGALALSYYGTSKENKSLSRIEINQVFHAVEWLRKQDSTDENKIVLYGVGKGAELALLTASKDKSIHSVVAISPSSHVLQSLGSNNSISPWTENKKDLPFVPTTNGFKKLLSKFLSSAEHQPDKIKESIIKYEEKGKFDAAIKVENIQGPILLISGENDAYWPSEWMSKRIIERLSESNFNYKVKHLSYKDAGHVFYPPYVPVSSHHYSLDTGGTNEGNAKAGEKAWNDIFDFLNYHFPPVEMPLEAFPFQVMK